MTCSTVVCLVAISAIIHLKGGKALRAKILRSVASTHGKQVCVLCVTHHFGAFALLHRFLVSSTELTLVVELAVSSDL